MSLNADVSSSWNGDFTIFRANISSMVFHCCSKWCEVSSSLCTNPSTSSFPLLNRFPMASTRYFSAPCSVGLLFLVGMLVLLSLLYIFLL